MIMPFGGFYEQYYANIYVPAIKAANLTPVRGDSLYAPRSIMEDVWRLIGESAVLLADLTGRNPNVLYELGLAHALGRPVVLVSATIEDVPFDLRALRVLVYDKNDDAWGLKLQTGITAALRETLADRSGALPAVFIDRVPQPESDAVEDELRKLRKELDALRAERTLEKVNRVRRIVLAAMPGQRLLAQDLLSEVRAVSGIEFIHAVVDEEGTRADIFIKSIDIDAANALMRNFGRRADVSGVSISTQGSD